MHSLSITFTSHYVSINSIDKYQLCRRILEFTSHYVSINSVMLCMEFLLDVNLHPTMYLLIRTYFLSVFPCLLYLHPTMYLLIPQHRHQYRNHCQNLHPTMYLLILINRFDFLYFIVIYIPLCIY